MIAEIVFIGAGNAAEAFFGGIFSDGLHTPDQVHAVEHNPERKKYIEGKFDIVVHESIGECIRNVPIVFLAVKPQNASDALDACAPHMQDSQLVISIVAGRSSDSIRQRLGGHQKVVRVMPNLAMQVRRGVTVMGIRHHTSDEDLARARRVLETVGVVAEVDENLIDAVTAVSGSGPGFVFLMMEALMEAALAQGLDARTARVLVVETFLGSSKLISELGEEPAVLRRRVCSPGGTTLEGIGVFEDSNIFGIFRKAIAAATRRASELGKEHD
jgi:pyrroline-5-carboxylate reductase